MPAEYAGAPLTLKPYPDRLCIYHQDKLIARHVRCYDRHQDFEDPDHPKALLAQRRKARDQKLFMRFLALSPKARAVLPQAGRAAPESPHHVRKIVALSEIYGAEPVARAIEDAFDFEAFSCEYIANLLEQRARFLPEPGALHLTRRQDLLDLEPRAAGSVHLPKQRSPDHDRTRLTANSPTSSCPLSASTTRASPPRLPKNSGPTSTTSPGSPRARPPSAATAAPSGASSRPASR